MSDGSTEELVRLPPEFLEFLAAAPPADTSDPDALRTTWRAWATLYAPGAPEPSPAAFESYFANADLPAAMVGWRFAGKIRRSQEVILREVEAAHEGPGDPLHIVAPPGSGKTLIGLLLALRQGHRTLALAPTATIRHQWARTAASLAAGTWGEERPTVPPGAVSEDPDALADFTALTYQMLSVVDSTNPFEHLAHRRWIDELVEAGRTEEDAREWLAELGQRNAARHRRGIRNRARTARREILREDPTRIEEALHPNARALITRLADAGVATIILDECHHLLDHWALVVHCLINTLRERGIEPQLIGLTATLPSTEDGEAYDNYTGLLREVDYELPTPAVVKEGNLAPYRSFPWFVHPTAHEMGFIRNHEKRLADLITATFDRSEGREFLTSVLQEGEGTPAQRLAQAFKTDPVIAEAASRMLHAVAPDDSLAKLFPRGSLTTADTDQQIRLLARYALSVLLPDPGRAKEWAQIKSVLVDFGYHLTDRGIRRGRDPIDAILATTEAKDHAVLDVLRLEREATAQVRGVVVCDFAVHGHRRGLGGAEGSMRAGALRCHAVLAGAEEIADMRPVLVTAQHLRVPTRDADLLATRLGQILGEPLEPAPVDGLEHVRELHPVAGSARVLAAVSRLITDGDISLIIGTRGLLGEGWDCPAVNTLIDLSAVATSASTQQLRGRTLRLDPTWPEKVAHNWTITCLLPPKVDVAAWGDLDRLERKLSMVWGLSLSGTDAIVKGSDHTISPRQGAALKDLFKEEQGASLEKLNGELVAAFPTREQTYARWRVGEEYLGQEDPAVRINPPTFNARPFRSGITLELFAAVLGGILLYGGVQGLRGYIESGGSLIMALIVSVVAAGGLAYSARKILRRMFQQIKQFALPLTTYEGATLAVAATLERRGEAPSYGRNSVQIVAEGDGRTPERYLITLMGGTEREKAAVLGAVEGLFAPITSPRFILEVGVSEMPWGSLVSRAAIRVLSWFGYRSRFFALPRALGRRREDARFFADQWALKVGRCTLHEITGPQDMAILTRARKQFGADSVEAFGTRVWA